jgi:hypothetical protein
LVRALDWGSRGRRFESCHPDYRRKNPFEWRGFSILLANCFFTRPSRYEVHRDNRAVSPSVARGAGCVACAGWAAGLRAIHGDAMCLQCIDY